MDITLFQFLLGFTLLNLFYYLLTCRLTRSHTLNQLHNPLEPSPRWIRFMQQAHRVLACLIFFIPFFILGYTWRQHGLFSFNMGIALGYCLFLFGVLRLSLWRLTFKLIRQLYHPRSEN